MPLQTILYLLKLSGFNKHNIVGKVQTQSKKKDVPCFISVRADRRIYLSRYVAFITSQLAIKT